MKCREFRDNLDNLIVSGRRDVIRVDLAEHVAACIECRREYEGALQTLTLLQPSGKAEASTELKESIMQKIMAAENAEISSPKRSPFWRPSFAMCAVILLVALVAAPFLVKSQKPVYALAQTVEANEALSSLHLKLTSEFKSSEGEVWAQYDETGNLQAVRMNFPDTEDGAKDVLWTENKVTVWFKTKGGVRVFEDESVLRNLQERFGLLDPKALAQSLYTGQVNRQANVQIDMPAATDLPVTVTVTSDKEPERQEVFKVDSQTKLLLEHDSYRLRNGDWALVETVEYLDYNQPLDPSLFVLDVPAEAIRVDETTQEIGLPQGNLSDHEIAKKVVREFFEALTLKDYAKVGRLFGGMPADEMEKVFSKLTVVRVVSVDEPVPHAETRSLKVPCKVEVARNGKTAVWEPKGPFVRQLDGQKDRWAIIGGI